MTKSHSCGLCHRGEFANAADCLHATLVDRGSRGIGSTEMRAKGQTGNPSERVRELEARGVQVVSRRRQAPNDRHQEAHYVLLQFAEAVAVEPSEPFTFATFSVDISTPEARSFWTEALDYDERMTRQRAAERERRAA